MQRTAILAAIGQLPQDLAVLTRAFELADGLEADLHVVHVLDLPGKEADLDDRSTFLGQANLAVRDRIAAALRDLGAESASVNVHVVAGAHALSLIDMCEEMAPDLIVMRAHQKKKLSERLLGSTTERVIAATATPVLVVKKRADRAHRRAVVATNGTDDALDRLQLVSRLLPRVRLQLVHVVHIPRQLKEAMLRSGAGRAAFADHREQLILSAEIHLKQVAEESGLRAAPVVFKGDPAKTLTEFCRFQNVDLIALGQARSTLVKRAFIGSVSRRVLREADCDVLIR